MNLQRASKTSGEYVGAGASGGATPVRVLALTKSTGGIALYHQALVAGFPTDRFAVHTLCLSDGADAYAATLRNLGGTAEVVGMARYRIDPLGDFRVMRSAMAAARRMGAQVIICHGSKPGFIGRAVGWWLGIETIYCQASMPFLSRIQGRKSSVYGLLERLAGLTRATIVCLSDGARAETVAHGIARAANLRVIKSGIDTGRFRATGQKAQIRRDLGLDAHRPVLGWIGRYEPQKAPEVFIAAAALAMRHRPDVQIVLAGDGRCKEQMVQQLADLGIAGQVCLLPWQADPVRLMQAIDVFALSSRWEGLPLILLETMAAGCVPVCTAVDGCAEVIRNGKDGFLVPPDNPSAMADAVLEALRDPQCLGRLSAAARTRVVTNFDASRMLAEWQALVLERAGVAQPQRHGKAAP